MEEYNKLFGTRAEPLFEAVDHPSANEGASELYGAWKQNLPGAGNPSAASWNLKQIRRPGSNAGP